MVVNALNNKNTFQKDAYRPLVTLCGSLPNRDPLWTKTPNDRNHPWPETPLDRDPLDKDPPGQRHLPGQRPPSPGQRPSLDRDPWTEIPPGQRPPGQSSPWTETPWSCDLWCMLGQRAPLHEQNHRHFVKTLLCRNFVAGSNCTGGSLYSEVNTS